MDGVVISAQSEQTNNVDKSNQNSSRLILESTLEAHDEKVWCLAWQPLRKGQKGPGLLASASSDKKIKIW